MTDQDIEKYINTPVGLALRELVDPLIESGEVVLANAQSVSGNIHHYLGVSIPAMPCPYGEDIGCGCLLGTAAEGLARSRGVSAPYSVISGASYTLSVDMKVSTSEMLGIEAGFESRDSSGWAATTYPEFYNIGRALALHYGLL